ncbi:exocyst complex component EXO70A1-like [Miscanthus floridulus]|uniref:exocyst complex component EXO70A1-like n=1 Tax=Miscanthus floridulus TaxID=154761 RepID=UPI00345AD2A5
MLKILTFVDIVVAWDPNTTQEFLSMDQIMPPPPYNKLISLLGVHDALSQASYKILTQIQRSTSVEVRRIENEMTMLLSAYKNKLGEAMRSTMEKIRTKSMEDGDDSSSPQGSSDIHKVTRSVMTYIRFLCSNYSSVDAAICGNEYVPHIENIPSLHSMTIEMVSCLQEKLANIAESFSDQALRFLFLLNNSYFIQEFQYFYCFKQPMLPVDFNHQIEDHMERYLQVSWAPLLSCLSNSTSLCLGKNYSPLSKFESEFEKTYTTQKQWKVPDPELRRRLREVITEKIIPDYKEYIEDIKASNPKISPLELEVMLQELFEG